MSGAAEPVSLERSPSMVYEMPVVEFCEAVGVSDRAARYWLSRVRVKSPRLRKGAAGGVLVTDEYLVLVSGFVKAYGRPRRLALSKIRAYERRHLRARPQLGVGGRQRVDNDEIGFENGEQVKLAYHPAAASEGDLCPYCGGETDLHREAAYRLASAILVTAVSTAAKGANGNARAFASLMMKVIGKNYREIGGELGISKQAIGKYRRGFDSVNRKLGEFFGCEIRTRGNSPEEDDVSKMRAVFDGECRFPVSEGTVFAARYYGPSRTWHIRQTDDWKQAEAFAAEPITSERISYCPETGEVRNADKN